MQVAKASTTIVKRAMTVIFQTVTKAVTTIAQFLAPFTMAIIVGAVTMALLLLSLQVHQLVLKDVLLIMYFQMEQQKEMHRLYGHT